jgi:hypothetical protein
MIRVDIYDFYSFKDRKEEFVSLYKFILSQESNEFEITLTTNSDMALWDYGFSAYAGELLWEIADRFEYHVPERGIERAHFFTVEVSDREKLVDVLQFVLNGYTGEDDEKYTNAALEHFIDVNEGRKDSVCPGIIKKLQKELMEEEGD